MSCWGGYFSEIVQKKADMLTSLPFYSIDSYLKSSVERFDDKMIWQRQAGMIRTPAFFLHTDSFRFSILLVVLVLQVAHARLQFEFREDAFSLQKDDSGSSLGSIGGMSLNNGILQKQVPLVNKNHQPSNKGCSPKYASQVIDRTSKNTLHERDKFLENILRLEANELLNIINTDSDSQLWDIPSFLQSKTLPSETEQVMTPSKEKRQVVSGRCISSESKSDELSSSKLDEPRSQKLGQWNAKPQSEGSSNHFSILLHQRPWFHEEVRQSSGLSDTLPAGITITLTDNGLSYLRDVLVNQVLQEVTPLQLPNMTKSMRSPIGILEVTLTDVVLSGARVASSEITLTKAGMSIYASGVQADITLEWNYTYVMSYGPIAFSDGGGANVKVKDGQAGVVFTLEEHNGTLNMTVLQSGTYLANLEISMNGGASWIYNWLAYAFGDQIRAAVEGALTSQILQGVGKLDSFLQHLRRQIPIDNTAAIDVTVVHNPILNPEYLSVGVKGIFLHVDSVEDSPASIGMLPVGLFCSNSLKMVTMALSDHVLNSAAAVYYNAGRLQRLVDKLPDQALLNTASWKYLIPKLYWKYPNQNMVLNFSVSSVPVIFLKQDGIHATTSTDMTILVMNNVQGTPVACISLTVSMDAVAGLKGNNITAEATLTSLSLQLKWSDIGSFPVKLVEVAVRTIVRDVVLPLLNLKFHQGFPLPVLPTVQLQHADVRYQDGFLMVCTDVRFDGGSI